MIRKFLCKIKIHSYLKIDKNIHHDFLECKLCGKRKFRFKRAFDQEYHWVKNKDFSKRPIIEDWINGDSYEKTREKLFSDWRNLYFPSINE